MHTEVHNAVTAADQGTQYDESAKRLLGQKSILAQILVRTVDEFKGMNPRYVETLIEGEPYTLAVTRIQFHVSPDIPIRFRFSAMKSYRCNRFFVNFSYCCTGNTMIFSMVHSFAQICGSFP